MSKLPANMTESAEVAAVAQVHLDNGSQGIATTTNKACSGTFNSIGSEHSSPDFNLAGTWRKDVKASDPMDRVCDIMHLNGVTRMAISLVRGIEIALKNIDSLYEYHLAVFSVFPWFKVHERYILNGTAAQYNRRDLRRGKHTGHAMVQSDGSIRLDMEWGPPHAGQGYDVLRLVTADELHVTSYVMVSGQEHTYTQVYRRGH